MNPAESWQPHEVPQAPPPVATPPIPHQFVPAVSQKSPWLAGLLALFPGIGHIYNGLYMRGITFFLIAFGLIGMADGGPDVIGVAIAFFWIFNVLDSYRQAALINYGYAQDLGLTDLPAHPRASQGGLVAGVTLLLIGSVALLDRFFRIDLEWIFDLWPVGLMAIGAWLIWGTIRDRRKASQDA